MGKGHFLVEQLSQTALPHFLKEVGRAQVNKALIASEIPAMMLSQAYLLLIVHSLEIPIKRPIAKLANVRLRPICTLNLHKVNEMLRRTIFPFILPRLA